MCIADGVVHVVGAVCDDVVVVSALTRLPLPPHCTPTRVTAGHSRTAVVTRGVLDR